MSNLAETNADNRLSDEAIDAVVESMDGMERAKALRAFMRELRDIEARVGEREVALRQIRVEFAAIKGIVSAFPFRPVTADAPRVGKSVIVWMAGGLILHGQRGSQHWWLGGDELTAHPLDSVKMWCPLPGDGEG